MKSECEFNFPRNLTPEAVNMWRSCFWTLSKTIRTYSPKHFRCWSLLAVAGTSPNALEKTQRDSTQQLCSSCLCCLSALDPHKNFQCYRRARPANFFLAGQCCSNGCCCRRGWTSPRSPAWTAQSVAIRGSFICSPVTSKRILHVSSQKTEEQEC